MLAILACLAGTACSDGTAAVGSVSQAVSALGAEHDVIINDFPLHNLSTVWIPTGQSTGRIVAAYTADAPVGVPGGTIAKYAYTDVQTWISGSTGQTQHAWSDAPAWPEPSNFCEIYPSCGANSLFVGYVGAAVALTTDHLNTAAIVAVARIDDGPFEVYQVVVVTSIDGGESFTNARIISTGPSGGHEFNPHNAHWRKIPWQRISSDETACNLAVRRKTTLRSRSPSFSCQLARVWI
jgi:hypothetical protein